MAWVGCTRLAYDYESVIGIATFPAAIARNRFRLDQQQRERLIAAVARLGEPIVDLAALRRYNVPFPEFPYVRGAAPPCRKRKRAAESALCLHSGCSFSPVHIRTTKLYDRTADMITLDEVERIVI
jgi:hypothetical protein